RLAMARPVAAETAQAVNGPARAEPGPEPAAALVTAQRLTLGQSRRLGLGAPLSNPEASVVQRGAVTPALDLAPPAHQGPPARAAARPRAGPRAGRSGRRRPRVALDRSTRARFAADGGRRIGSRLCPAPARGRRRRVACSRAFGRAGAGPGAGGLSGEHDRG